MIRSNIKLFSAALPPLLYTRAIFYLFFSFVSGVRKFYLAHWQRQLTHDTKSVISGLQTSLLRRYEKF